MARTPLFHALTRASGAGTALSRRAFLVTAAAAAACAPQVLAPRGGRGEAIVGGGTAGLTIAYRLAKAGRPATLYEASNRFGGRMFTRRHFNEDDQFIELGGELVDSNHTALMSLARELGVGIDRLEPENSGAEDLYHIDNRLYAQRDLLDAHGQGAFRELAGYLATDQAALLVNDEWTGRARALDAMSIKAYLQSHEAHAPGWVLKLIDLAYLGEFGIPTDQQSALNLVDMIGADLNAGGFKMFGDSDELFRIRNGSSSLPDALVAHLTDGVARKPGHALVAVAKTERGVRLTFDGPQGRVEQEHDSVAFALPFTRLRQVAGVETLGLDAEKLRAIRELGYGDNAKIMVSTRSRPWRDAARRYPAPSNGTFYSDRGMQVVWETSRGQAGDRGVLTNFLSGVEDDGAILKLAEGLQAASPAVAESLDMSKRATMFWARQPNQLGSYASAKVGQYTTLLEVAATPAFDGRVQFAGEHTSADFLGYMNGAVESGERAAAALLGHDAG